MFSLRFSYAFFGIVCFTTAPHPRPHAADPSFWDSGFSYFFFDVLCGCLRVGTLAPKWGPRRPKWGPRRPETTPRPSQDPQNRGQDLPQDLEIPRSNIEAENSCFFVQKSMIPAMIFSCFFDIVVTSSLCFIDIS